MATLRLDGRKQRLALQINVDGDALKGGQVHPNPVALHLGQHRNERKLHVSGNFAEAC